jgi:hypothetical protein
MRMPWSKALVFAEHRTYDMDDQYTPYPGKQTSYESNERYYTVKKRATTELVETTTKNRIALVSFKYCYIIMTIGRSSREE